ncbi:hypothetical protein Poly24_45830 [Rosistilla carotiformis]|uniref:Uncharacterized protein n=1 Tax=Rosistilla carotiformis TaxID=2528017 RepID=A0A518JZ80_9BACT|nr:hypothetical protein Poly24_45830 [Rosistilla carotiformis]
MEINRSNVMDVGGQHYWGERWTATLGRGSVDCLDTVFVHVRWAACWLTFGAFWDGDSVGFPAWKGVG